MAKKVAFVKRGLTCICRHCQKTCDLTRLAMEAENASKRNVYCPHCGQRVGQLQ